MAGILRWPGCRGCKKCLIRRVDSCCHLVKLRTEFFLKQWRWVWFTLLYLMYFIFDINKHHFLRDLVSWSPNFMRFVLVFFKLCYWNCAVIPEEKHKGCLPTWELPWNRLREKKKWWVFFFGIQRLWKPWLKTLIDMGIVEETVEPMFTSFLPVKLCIS